MMNNSEKAWARIPKCGKCGLKHREPIGFARCAEKPDRRLLAKYGEVMAEKIICDWPANWDTCQGDSADWCKHGRRYPHVEQVPNKPDPRAAELALIRSVADDVVTRVMKEGEASHAVGHWKDVSDVEHWTHADDHMVDYRCSTASLTDIEHAIVRLLFIVAKAKQKEDGK